MNVLNTKKYAIKLKQQNAKKKKNLNPKNNRVNNRFKNMHVDVLLTTVSSLGETSLYVI